MKNDKRHGYGIFTRPDHYKYSGNWKDDLKWGYGEEVFPSGNNC